MFDEQDRNQKKQYKRSGLAFSVLGAIVAVFIVTTVFQWQGISIDVHTEKPTAQANELNLDKKQEDVTQAVDEVSKAVVGISNVQNAGQGAEKAGTGSGVIYKKDGDKAFVATNHHVIQNASELEVILSDGTKVEAELKGSDPLTDLAVLQIDSEHVQKVAELGKASDVEVGQTAIAIGNPLGMEFAGSVTKGIVSGLNRNIPVDMNGDQQPDWQTEVLQTDAAINPGNSGGALINLQGEVIGINSMKIAKAEVEGIGFSIPMDVAKPVIKDLEKNGEVERPYMGVSLQDLTQIPNPVLQRELGLPEDITQGVLVQGVEKGSPADQAGLKRYDVITAIDGKEIESLISLRQYLYNQAKDGDTAELEVYRDGKPTTVQITLTSR
ncbi:serine protease Do [Halobacillus karajensis]|uniref:Serine protease Do-like HtrA n=1 Tax=Halobacillus karajensis TaxID=195088 RepID=A0A024P478_9BACI|nr:trypsin-like peptidase domain-containing protein [Halobacillus karajensis]CDQ18720.1 Serine protease Do-like HtrA [Halobacillus karajensis]CDQ23208.1 Serine protease Do-like HtrA [Halobacillus karajensis]CDQ26690.1 Serine protease Do-like HtrA [Halobacillus karajensis]SEH47566.1 serine protease Do [Halobacillus karajensis]